MRSIPKSVTIQEEGLQPYLDRTRVRHNNLGYPDFVRLVKSGVDKANLARAFNVDRHTIYKWLEVYEGEVK